MKITMLFSAAMLCMCLFSQTATAQTAVEAEVLKAWNGVMDAFQKGDNETMWAFYTDDAAEIDPAGVLTSGKKTLRENWDAFMKMASEKPVFKMENEQVRLLNPTVAIVTWDGDADIKIGGQQVGGKTKGMALLHKIKGQWMCEFDSITPVMPMPEGK